MPFAALNGAQIYYDVHGTGTSIVFTHAGIADHRMWDRQVAAFAERYQVIRWDMRGFGKTAMVDGEFSLVMDLAALLDFLKIDSAVLVGCSMGGGASMDYALEHPERAKALVMVGSGPGGLELDVPESPLFAEEAEAFKAKDRARLIELGIRIWFEGEGRTAADMNPDQRALMQEMIGIAIDNELKGIGKHVRAVKQPAAERLDQLKMPVLIVYGDRDEPYMRAAADHMEQHIAGARKVLMPNTAHLPNLERPDEFNRILDEFLRDAGIS
jgi:pimeloyl-ACP methyl ester carboxylesterase